MTSRHTSIDHNIERQSLDSMLAWLRTVVSHNGIISHRLILVIINEYNWWVGNQLNESLLLDTHEEGSSTTAAGNAFYWTLSPVLE